MYAIKNFARKKNLKIIEDCSQAHGASINNKEVGSFSDVSTWSFCNDKIISTLGEGGIISTNNKKIYKFCKKYINHGTTQKKIQNQEKFIYNKDLFGTNLRLTEIQSFAGLEQLKCLKQTQKKRQKIAKDYFKLISKYKKYFFSYYPPKQIRSAWYRFYFFIKPNIRNYKKIRLDIIRDLNKRNLRCFSGSCPEIYLEKSFKKLKNFKIKRLKNCKILGETSLALDVNHTLNLWQHKKDLLKIKRVIEKFIKDK
jgi:dTDP-4-amino-4,6-dideoxygalactose transaminase